VTESLARASFFTLVVCGSQATVPIAELLDLYRVTSFPGHTPTIENGAKCKRCMSAHYFKLHLLV